MGAEKTAAYRKPVLQVELSQIQVEKKWEGAAPEDVEITVSLYRDSDSHPYSTLTLTDEGNWQGVGENLPSGHTYTVKETLDGALASYESTVAPAEGIHLPLGDTNTGENARSFTITNALKVASFTFTKVDADSNDTLLAGAKFELWPAGDDWVKDSNVDKPLYPTYQDNGESTGQDGNATFTDIPFGNYLLYEVKAPAGYKLPTDPVRVTVEAGMVTFMKVNGEMLDEIELPSGDAEDATGEAATIPNKEQEKLPVAGGMGVIWFSAGGLALASAAALLYFKQRKKGEE